MKYKPILQHHGILGQAWGKRNGPPYPLRGGDYTPEEKRKIYAKRRGSNTIYNKKHFDEVLKADKTKLQTLSFDENRTKNTDMFYASHNILDNNVYKALLNQPIPKDVFDENGNKIGTDKVYRFAITNKLKNDVNVASEDSAARIFSDLYKKDRNFYNFITDPNRMLKYFDDKRYGHAGYREARDVLNNMRENPDYKPSYKDIQTIYRMFNFILPYADKADARGAHDVVMNRTKFFNECKKNGYGAILDTNDSIYNKLHAKSPVVVFDMEQVIPDEVKNTDFTDRAIGIMTVGFRKSLGI